MGMFSRLDPHVQRVSGWLTVAGFLLSGAYTMLARAAPFFGDWSWPGLILLGIGGALATLLIVSLIVAVGAYGFRLIRPLPATRTPVLDHPAEPMGNEVLDQLRDDLNLGLSRLIERVSNIEADIATAKDGEDTLRAAIQSFMGAAMNLATELNDRVSDRVTVVEATYAAEVAGLKGALDKLEKETVASLQESLVAIYHRERMLSLAKVIDEKSLELGLFDNPGKVMDEEEWESWKSSALQWEFQVSEWAKWAATYYGREPMNDIKRIDAEGLNENWGVKAHQFPSDPEGLRIYKTFRIYARNWANINKVIHERVRRRAFEGVQV